MSEQETISPYVMCPMVDIDVPRIRCMFCPYGHMLECHYPLECAEAECSHYMQTIEEDEYGWQDPMDEAYEATE